MDEQKVVQALERLEEKVKKLEESQADLTKSLTESSRSEAQLKDEEVARLQEKAQQHDKFLAELKAIEGNPALFAELAGKLGYTDRDKFEELARNLGFVIQLVAEAKEEVEEEPEAVVGEREGYKFLRHLGISIKE